MTSRLVRCITFADRAESGNPARVLVLDAEAPPVDVPGLAAQLGAFITVIRPTAAGRHRISFATPEGPHNGAGHASHGAAHLVLPGDGETVLERDDGSCLLARRVDGQLAVEWPVMPYDETDLGPQIGAALGILPQRTLVAPFGHVALMASEAEVAALDPDLGLVETLDRGSLIVTAAGSSSDIVIRVFAPKLGLPEDPVCGTAHRIIIPYWAAALRKPFLHSRHLSPRAGDLYCTLHNGVVALGGAALTLDEMPWDPLRGPETDNSRDLNELKPEKYRHAPH